MSANVSTLSQVDPRAELGEDVEIGPFCVVGPHVRIGKGTRLDSHVAIVGHTVIGERNRFFPGAVIGAEPQDIGYSGSATRLEIGDENIFREGATVHRGAEKEDGCTRIGNRNMLMANSHVAHNCHLFDHVILVNGVLLGGHVHVHDGAIISGNSVVHHFSTLGTLCFIGGGSRVPQDVPPYMLAQGSDRPTIKTVNIVGMQRRGFSGETIGAVKRTHRLLYREHRKLDDIRQRLDEELDGKLPEEVVHVLNFVEQQQQGRLGRARDPSRNQPAAE